MGSSCELSQLGVEQACLHLTSSSLLWLRSQSSVCVECPLLDVGAGPWFVVNSSHVTQLSLLSLDSQVLCSTQRLFEAHSIYAMNESCFITLQTPYTMSSNALLALLLSLFALMACALRCVYRSRYLRRLLVAVRPQQGRENEDEDQEEMNSVISADLVSDLRLLSDDNVHFQLSRQQRRMARDRKKRSRLRALDAFRGMSVALMIFVNYGGGGYVIFGHSVWDGLSVADVVFPAFVWAMGLSIVLSLHAQLRNGRDKRRIAQRALRRALVLVLLGLFINARSASNQDIEMEDKATDLSRLRLPSVLQRLGVAYAVAVSVALFTVPRDLEMSSSASSTSFLASFRAKLRLWVPDLMASWPELLMILVLASVHTLITFLLPLPSPCPKGYLGPGGLHAGGKYFNCTGGAAGLIDRLLLGHHHLYQRSSARVVYQSEFNYDPEGLLGNLTCSLLALIGVMAGKVLLYFTSCKSRLIRWCIWASTMGFLGLLLCNFDIWASRGLVPVNKQLWSLSYVLITAAISTLIFALLYVFIDVLGVYRGIPFYYLGMNPILIYVGHLVVRGCFPFAWQPLFLPVSHLELLLMHLWAVGLWSLIAYALFKANFFLAL